MATLASSKRYGSATLEASSETTSIITMRNGSHCREQGPDTARIRDREAGNTG